MPASSLIDELEIALAKGSNTQRIEMLARITDLFADGANQYSPEQINLFDEVMVKLSTAIEAKARAKLAVRLAEIANAPAVTVQQLAFDDDIEVARPILQSSERLTESDLVANASSKSQLHLAAIAERKTLPSTVTDVLVTRGDRNVVHSVTRNTGARFSDAGFRLLVSRAASDDTLALQVGARRDLPRQHFLRVLAQASDTVRARLTAENPEAGNAVVGVLGDVVGSIRSELRKMSRDYASKRAEVDALARARRLSENEVYRYARERRFEETAVALSHLCEVDLDTVERALLDARHEISLILSKVAGFSSTTAKAILLLKAADRGLSTHDLDHALNSYTKLQPDTARRVLGFYHARSKRPVLAANG